MKNREYEMLLEGNSNLKTKLIRTVLLVKRIPLSLYRN